MKKLLKTLKFSIPYQLSSIIQWLQLLNKLQNSFKSITKNIKFRKLFHTRCSFGI